MSGICGWIGGAPPGEQVLGAMAAGLPWARTEAFIGATSDTAALGVETSDGRGGFVENGRFLIAIDGSLRWSNPEFAALSKEQGQAHALLAAFQRHGASFFDVLSGPFSLALLDREAGEAILAIDRFGVHTMHFAASSTGGLAFGTTAECVRRHPDVDSAIDPQAVFNYFNVYNVPAPGTIYKGHRKLLPGQYVHYRRGQVEPTFYWQLDYKSSTPARPADLRDELHGHLECAMGRALEGATGNVGAFLSGGLDSSTVVGLLHRVSRRPPRAFTVGFDAAEYDEMGFARIAATRFSAHHHEHYLTPAETADVIPRIAAFYDEPFGNSSAVPSFVCARAAKGQAIDVMLAGDGGDEIFAGNARYAKEAVLERYFRAAQMVPAAVIGPALSLLRGPRLMRRARNYLALLTTPLPDRMVVEEHLSSSEVAAMFAPEFLGAVQPEAPLELARETYERPASGEPLHRMMYLDLKQALADNDLRKVVTTCRMAGVQVRFPFLDEDLVSFAARIPAEILLRGGELRAFYKRAMRGFLPDQVIDKTKHGFGMPYGLWIAKEKKIRDLVIGAIEDFKRRPISKPSYVTALIQRSSSDDWRATARLWDIMMLELWFQAHRVSI